MKISFLKYKQDTENYKIAKGLGMEIFEIENVEQVDSKIQELKNARYTTVVIPSDLASFSEDIIKRL